MLGGRQRRAEALKKLADVAVRMSDEQLGELRADIKVRLGSRSGSQPSTPEFPAAPRRVTRDPVVSDPPERASWRVRRARVPRGPLVPAAV